MSDQNDLLRTLYANEARLKQTETKEVPPLYPPFVNERLLPFPLASSANALGYFGQPWAVNLLAFYVTVFVLTTNNGANFWTITLTDNAANILASVNTSGIAANTSTRLSDVTITQPAAANTAMTVIATATGSPGSIYIVPAVALLRTGN